MTALSPTYLCFGCVDIANNARTKQYILWAITSGRFKGDPGVMIAYMHHLCSCPADDEAWTNPIADGACWYDPAIPESADFLGVVIEQARGVRNANVKREVSDAINGGSVLGQLTESGKQIVLEVLIVATSKAGQNYGEMWLNRQLEGDGKCAQGGSSCASCQGQLLTIRTHCYDATVPLVDQPVDKGLHTWAAGGVIDGFVPDEDRFPAGSPNCEKMMAGSLTIATEQRSSYTTEPVATVSLDAAGEFMFRALGNCLPERQQGIADPRCPSCLTLCDPCRDDPGCDCLTDTAELEPASTAAVSACFTDPLCRCIGSAQVTDLPAGYETAFRITMDAGWNPDNQVFQKYGMRNAVIRIFERDELEEENGIVMPTNLEQYEDLTARIAPCVEIGVAWIPAGAQLVIDGLSGRTWLLCNGQCYDHSQRVHTISGTVFPLAARCTDLIFTIEWDCLNVNGESGPGQIPSSATIESFRGFNL